MENRVKLVQQLRKYSKDELIDAFTRMNLMDDYHIARVLHYLHDLRVKAAFAKQEKALSDWSDASDKYNLWVQSMCKKYGDGKSFNLSRLSPAELQHGCQLEKAANTAWDCEQAASAELERILKEGYAG